MSRPLRPITRPYWVAVMPDRPMSTASVVEPCWATRASSRLSTTTAMKRPSRKTAPRPIAGGAFGPSEATTGESGLVSGMRTKMTTAQTTVESASSRKSVR